jgi:hypothetical protein
VRIARLAICAVVLLTACDGSTPQAPPLDPPPTSSPSESGGVCGQTVVDGATALRFESDGNCLDGDVMVLFRCSPTAVPVLRISSARGPAMFLGGPFAVRVTTLPANVRFAGTSGSTDVLIADPPPPSPSPTASASPDPTLTISPSPSAGPVAPPEPEPLVYVRQGGVTERWLRVGGRRSIHEPPIAWLIGDSILDGGREPVEEGLPGWQLTMDTEVGRSSSSGVSLAEEAALQDADVVLVELGTNDASSVEFRSTLRQTLDVLRAVPLVIWQTARGPVEDTSIPGVNAAIREVVPTYPNTAIADWEAFVPADALGSDGIHPNEGFEHLESDLLLPMLTRWRAAITRVGSTACGRDVLRETS